MEGSEKRERLMKMHEENLRKMTAAANQLEKEADPVLVAYMAGRLEGALDAKWIRERSA